MPLLTLFGTVRDATFNTVRDTSRPAQRLFGTPLDLLKDCSGGVPNGDRKEVSLTVIGMGGGWSLLYMRGGCP